MEFLREVAPNSIEAWGSVILGIWVVLMISMERIFPYTKGVKFFRRGFWMDLVWYTIIQSYLLKILIFDWIIAPGKSALGLSELGYISHWPIWVLVLFFLISHDFYIYWFHRLQHSNRWLWRTHEAHHSVRECDWLAGSRSHAVEILINQTIEFAPIFFLLDNKTAAIIVPIKALLDAIWGMWIHANINVKTGKLQYVINGPEMHQWHHANHEEVFYANYSTKFAFFDWIFGTAFMPGLNPIKWPALKPLSFGLPYAYPEDFFSQTVYAFWRYDFKKIENAKWYRSVQDSRQYLLNAVTFSRARHWLRDHIFDRSNARYEVDDAVPNCGCGRPMKQYNNGLQWGWHCDCEESQVGELSKFGV
ncbi:MAG: sterol desaturase family protein [Bacteroidota bacterium]